MIRSIPVPMMIDSVVCQERRHTLREEWFCLLPPVEPVLALLRLKRGSPHRAITNHRSVITNHPALFTSHRFILAGPQSEQQMYLATNRIMADLERREALDMADLRTGGWSSMKKRARFGRKKQPTLRRMSSLLTRARTRNNRLQNEMQSDTARTETLP